MAVKDFPQHLLQLLKLLLRQIIQAIYIFQSCMTLRPEMAESLKFITELLQQSTFQVIPSDGMATLAEVHFILLILLERFRPAVFFLLALVPEPFLAALLQASIILPDLIRMMNLNCTMVLP